MISRFDRPKSPKARHRHPNPIKQALSQALFQAAGAACSLLLLVGCSSSSQTSVTRKVEVKLLVGSALAEFCTQAAQQFNQQNSTLDNGTVVQMTCESQGSGDVVTNMLSLAEDFQSGVLHPMSPQFPTLLSVDGEIYHSQLRYQMEQLFPGQNYIPEITDAPLIANSPMVFVAQKDLASGLNQVDDLFKVLVTAKTHQDIDPNSSPLAINYVHTAPTRSNSGLQTLVAQFASVSGKRPEALTVADVTKYQQSVEKIQHKITRYGISTNSLAEAMANNGVFWASVGSVYESSVIEVNSNLPPNQQPFQAIYPKATFTSNMRAILPNAPWVSDDEKAGAGKIIEYLRSPQGQEIATNLGLRPGVPGVALGSKFSSSFGVDPNAKYDSLRPPQPEVVETMLQTWQNAAKKPSLVAVVVDSSGSMKGEKIIAVQNTLNNYIKNLGSRDRVALIDFDSEIREPTLVDGTAQGRNLGVQFINGLQADGGTKLYDAALFARNWLQKNPQANAINAVLILTDGEDSGSNISLRDLRQELQKSGFDSDDRIAFFTIGYGDDRSFNPQALEEIAESNGGYYKKGDVATISQVMADLQMEF